MFIAVLIAYELTVYFFSPRSVDTPLEEMAVIFDKRLMCPYMMWKTNGTTEQIERL